MLLNDFHLPLAVKVIFGIFILLATSLAQAVQLKGRQNPQVQDSSQGILTGSLPPVDFEVKYNEFLKRDYTLPLDKVASSLA
jgi:hypothetical protein